MTNLIDAATNFETETAVPRALFKAVSERGDGPAGVDVEALFQAGRALTEAADRLLAVLLPHDEQPIEEP